MSFQKYNKKFYIVLNSVREILYNEKRNPQFDMEITPNPEGWILAFIYAGNPINPDIAEIKGKLLFIKEFLVFIKEIKPELDEFYQFIPYNYGPYSFPLISMLDRLINEGLIDVSVEEMPMSRRYDYKLTKRGIEIARDLYKNVDPNTKSRLEQLRSDATKMGYLGVLRYVYSRYPEYTTASKIKEFVKNGT